MADQPKTGNGNPGTSPATAAPATAANPTRPDNVGEAREHLGRAASAVGDSVRGATRAARDELRTGTAGVRSELNEAATASRAAAYDARDMADEKLHEAMAQGRDLLHSAEHMIREKPLQAIGVAVLAGYLFARLRG